MTVHTPDPDVWFDQAESFDVSAGVHAALLEPGLKPEHTAAPLPAPAGIPAGPVAPAASDEDDFEEDDDDVFFEDDDDDDELEDDEFEDDDDDDEDFGFDEYDSDDDDEDEGF